MISEDIHRVQLANLPTPVEPLTRLTATLGLRALWIKRDDLTGLAFGGNKTRKLELLLADAEHHGARTLITRGAVQSNHCRQTAAAAARMGLECILVLAGRAPDVPSGNYLLDRMLGAEVVWTSIREAEATLDETFQRAEAQGRRPYRIPYGGSNALGAAAYALAMQELLEQGVQVDRIVFASSSGGTQAGLVVGARALGFPGRISGISVDEPSAVLRRRIADLAGKVAQVLGREETYSEEEVEIYDGYLGGGYGVLGGLERRAIETFARLEGVLLDPVYTGRAAGALLDLVDRGEIDHEERVLFWHTGGAPAIFAYAQELAQSS